jgi:hypothetical protein
MIKTGNLFAYYKFPAAAEAPEKKLANQATGPLHYIDW